MLGWLAQHTETAKRQSQEVLGVSISGKAVEAAASLQPVRGLGAPPIDISMQKGRLFDGWQIDGIADKFPRMYLAKP